MSVLDIFKKKKQQREKQGMEKERGREKVFEKKEAPKVNGQKQEKVSVPAPVPKKEIKTEKTKRANRETGNAYKILKRPLVTEKVTEFGVYNQYAFEVAEEANKIEIKKAIASVYGVKPLKVRVVLVGGKSRRYGRVRGRTRSWKKAIITLKPGEKIEVYEGV